MSKKTMMKPIAAMLLAFALLLTGVVPGAAVTAKAAEEGTYAVFVYEDEDGNEVKSEPIKEEETFELNQDRKGKFYLYDGGELVTTGSTPWSGGIIRSIGSGVGEYDPENTSTNAFVHTGRGRFMGMAWLSFNIKIVVDTTMLDEDIEEAEKIGQGSYSDETWEEFTNILNEAKKWKEKISEDQDKSSGNVKYKVTQQNIDDASIDLSDALLVLKQEDLNNAIKKAEEIKNDNYTEESWKAFTDALSTAKSLMSDEIVFVSPEDLQAATEDLNNAIASLKKKPAEVTTEKKTETTTVKQETTAQYTVAKTTLKKARKSGKKVQLTWKKVKAATGYEVYQATKKNGKYKKVKTIKKNKVVTCKTKALKANKKYFFKVRTYRKVAGTTVYGKFSNVKKVIMK